MLSANLIDVDATDTAIDEFLGKTLHKALQAHEIVAEMQAAEHQVHDKPCPFFACQTVDHVILKKAEGLVRSMAATLKANSLTPGTLLELTGGPGFDAYFAFLGVVMKKPRCQTLLQVDACNSSMQLAAIDGVPKVCLTHQLFIQMLKAWPEALTSDVRVTVHVWGYNAFVDRCALQIDATSIVKSFLINSAGSGSAGKKKPMQQLPFGLCDRKKRNQAQPKKPKAAQWKRIGSAGFNMCQPLLSDWVSNGELEDPASRRAA